MSLFDTELAHDRRWGRVNDGYAVTRKPRALDRAAIPTIPFAAMEAIPQNGTFAPDFEMRSSAAIKSGTYFERGDLLIAKITPSFENGKQAWVQDLSTPFGYATTEVIPIRPTGEADPRLLFFYLLHPDVRHFVAERMEGSTGRQRVPEEVLLNLPMPSIDACEGHQISNVLEAVQKAIATETSAAIVVQELKRTAMREVFSRGLHGEPQKETEIGLVPESWTVAPLSELCTFASGGTPSKSNSAFWSGNVPWVSGKDLKQPVLHDVPDRISDAAASDSSKIAPADAVLILVRGMGLAKDLPISLLARPMAFNQDIKAIVSKGTLSGSFLRSAIYDRKHSLLGRIVPSAHGTMTLNLDDLETFQIAFPSKDFEADEIVATFDAIDAKLDLHRRKQAVLEELFRSLLHELITGEIRAADLDLSALAEFPDTEGVG